MSQSGVLDVVGSNPQIPTTFIADIGSAIPIANVLEILGDDNIQTTGSGNTITIELTGDFAETITGNNGTPLSPTDQNWNIVGAGNIITSGSASTLTVTLTSITQHAVQLGASPTTLAQSNLGTNGQVFLGADGAAPAFGTLTSLGGTITFSPGANSLNLESGGSVPIQFTTDSGIATPVAGNINTLGDGSITTTGVGDTITTQLTGLTNHNVLVGAGTTTITKVPPSATVGIPLVSQGAAADPVFGTALVAGGGTAATSFNINGAVISNTTGTGALAALTLDNGQFVIGSTGTTPVASTLTSSAGTITITPGAGSLNIDLAGGSMGIDSIHPDSGTDPVVPDSNGLVNIVGSGSTTTVGSLNTLTVELTGLTNHSLLVGAGTATITKVGPTATAGQVLQSAGVSADPAFSTATYPSTTTINQILYSSASNVVSELATANRGVLTTGATGVPVITALATDGQLIIGSTAGVPAAATLTAGTNISITNAANSITIDATGGGDVVGPGSATANALVRFDLTTGKLIKNGVTTEDDTGNISQSASVSGATLSYTLANTSDTASAKSAMLVQVAGSTADDAYYQVGIAGGQVWTWGVDNSLFDSFALSNGSALGTGNIYIVSGLDQKTTWQSGDVSVDRSASASTVELSCKNAEATNASSDAMILTQTNGASAGDPYLGLLINGVTGYSLGIDNSDSDSLKINNNSTFSGTDYWKMTSAGQITMPLQPAFLATASTVHNVTGNGTNYLLGSSSALTEVYDQGSNFNPGNGAGTAASFTAPVSGRYLLCYAVSGLNFTIATRIVGALNTSNRDYGTTAFNPTAVVPTAPSRVTVGVQQICDMDATDTAQFSITVDGEAGNTVSVAAAGTLISGALIC